MNRLCWIIACALLIFGAAFAQTKKPTKVQQTKDKLRVIDKKEAAIKKDLKEVRTEQKEVRGEMQWVEGKLRSINAVLQSTLRKLANAKAESAKVDRELIEANAKMTRIKNQIKKRIRSMYVQSDEPMVMVLIGSRDAASFASRKALLERIADRDRTLFDEVKSQREVVAEKKRRREILVKEMDGLRKQQRAEQARLDEARKDKLSLLRNLNHKEDLLDEQLDELEKESNKLEAAIAAYQNRAGGSSIPYRGGFIRPCSGRLTSGFGMRTHPISGRRKLHAGVDFGAPTGTPIYAAAPGTVITATTMRGYGRTVVIDHGGGTSTLYGHCSALLVRSGQKVRGGQMIARVGSTGYSTGPHLHFEVRVNGRPVNPLSRL